MTTDFALSFHSFSSLLCKFLDKVFGKVKPIRLRRAPPILKRICAGTTGKRETLEKMGLTGLEPVTLRLSSACSNQLSYRPGSAAEPPDFRLSIFDSFLGALLAHLLKSAIAIRKSKIEDVLLRHGYGATVYALLYDASEDWRQGDYAPASASDNVPGLWFCLHAFSFGGKGIRTPDFQLAKLALYQLSYAPIGVAEFRLPIFDCKEEKKNAGCRSYDRHPACVRFFERAKLRSLRTTRRLFSFVSVPQQAPPNTVFSHLHRSLYP
jgi:hypothetical protein